MRTFYVQKCAQTYMIIDWKTFLGQDLDPDISHTCINIALETSWGRT